MVNRQTSLTAHVTKKILIKGRPPANTSREINAGQDRLDTYDLLEKALASLAEAVIIQDPNTRVIWQVNAASERILVYAPQELVEKTTEILYENREAYLEMSQNIRNGRRIFSRR